MFVICLQCDLCHMASSLKKKKTMYLSIFIFFFQLKLKQKISVMGMEWIWKSHVCILFPETFLILSCSQLAEHTDSCCVQINWKEWNSKLKPNRLFNQCVHVNHIIFPQYYLKSNKGWCVCVWWKAERMLHTS